MSRFYNVLGLHSMYCSLKTAYTPDQLSRCQDQKYWRGAQRLVWDRE